MTLQEASRLADFTVIAPATDIANADRLTGVWAARYGAGDAQVALQYDGGALSILENTLADPDPTAILARYNEDAGAMNQAVGRTVFFVTTVGSTDTPVLVGVPGSDAYRSNPASVEIAIGDIDVLLQSSTYGVDQLLAVAQSMAESSRSP